VRHLKIFEMGNAFSHKWDAREQYSIASYSTLTTDLHTEYAQQSPPAVEDMCLNVVNKKLRYCRDSARPLPQITHCQKQDCVGYILGAESMGLPSVNLTQLAPKAAILFEITRNDGRLRSLKVTFLFATSY